MDDIYIKPLEEDSFNNYTYKMELNDYSNYTEKELIYFIEEITKLISVYVLRIKELYNLTLNLSTGENRDYFEDFMKSRVMSGGGKLDEAHKLLLKLKDKLQLFVEHDIMPLNNITYKQKELINNLKSYVEKQSDKSNTQIYYTKDNVSLDTENRFQNIDKMTIDKMTPKLEYHVLSETLPELDTNKFYDENILNKCKEYIDYDYNVLGVSDFFVVTENDTKYDIIKKKKYRELVNFDNTQLSTCSDTKNDYGFIIELSDIICKYKELNTVNELMELDDKGMPKIINFMVRHEKKSKNTKSKITKSSITDNTGVGIKSLQNKLNSDFKNLENRKKKLEHEIQIVKDWKKKKQDYIRC